MSTSTDTISIFSSMSLVSNSVCCVWNMSNKLSWRNTADTTKENKVLSRNQTCALI